jgi:tetratricopeptide (TPR) repeat protein
VRAATVAALLALTIALFAGVAGHGWFGIDDDAYVRANPHVNAGLTAANVGWELTHADAGNFAPLTMLSHMLDVQVFGLQPGSMHVVSMLFHALNAALLLLVLYGWTGAWWRSAAVALLFAIHPLRVEPVAWIASRKDVLSLCCFLLTLELWRRWTRDPAPWRYALACMALLLGLLAKPVLVVTPFVLLLLEAWPLQRLAAGTLWMRVREKWAMWLLAAAFVIVGLRTQGATGALALVPGLTPLLRVSNALRTVWIYVGQCFWPVRLVAFEPHDLQLHALACAAALLGLVAMTALVLALRKRRPWLALGWLWYVGTLVPVLNLVQVGPHARADRFTYLPAIGLAVMLVWELADRLGRSRAGRIAATALVLLAAGLLGAATARQVAAWRDTRTMYERILAVEPGRGTVLIRWLHGDMEMVDGHPAAALADYEQVARFMPGHPRAQMDVANALGRLGRVDEALAHVERAVALAPDSIEYRRLLAEELKARGRYGEALTHYEAIAQRRPDDLNALLNAAWMRATLPDPAQRDGARAVAMAGHALAIIPQPPAALLATAAAAYAESGRWDDAIAAAGRAIEVARAADSPGEVDEYARELTSYRAHRAWRAAPH